MKVLELFSGMGGMHYALMDAGVTFEVVAALDISEVSNRGECIHMIVELLRYVVGFLSHKVNKMKTK
jgi:Site-specific DNA methylase